MPAKLKIAWPLSRLGGRKVLGWLMIAVMAQLILGTAKMSQRREVDIVVLALQLATLVAMVLIQTNRIGPRPADPVAQAFD